MRPIRPEPEDRPKIKRAMRATRIMQWISGLIGFVVLAAIIVGETTEWYFGVGVFVVSLPFFTLGYLAARCPRCGQVWWGEGPGWASYGDVEDPTTVDETETMVCRRCRLDIALGLREK